MRATCPHCQRGFLIPDEKLVPGKAWAVACPACKGRVSVSAPAPSPPRETGQGGNPESEPFPLPSGAGSGGLCCVSNGRLRERVLAVLEKAGYGMVCPSSPEQGVERLRFTSFPLVVYQEGYDPDPGSGVWQWLSGLSGEERRRVFLVWLGAGVPAGDPMFTLSKSADLSLDEREVEDLPMRILGAQEVRKRFYAPLRMVLKGLAVETDLPD